MTNKNEAPRLPTQIPDSGSEAEAASAPSGSSPERTGGQGRIRPIKDVQAAHGELAQTYARIDALREELRIVESALRLKDPVTSSLRHPTPAFKLPETQLTFDETKDIHEARKELRQELQALETRRDRLESELLPPEDAEAMRKARADIEAIPEEDLLFGGGKIEEPDYGQHVMRRINETISRKGGGWHLQHGVRWVLEKTGLQGPITKFEEWLEKKLEAFHQDKEARLAAGKSRKALPPGREDKAKQESDRRASEGLALVDRLDAKMMTGGFAGSEEMLSELPRLTEDLKHLSRRLETEWHGPQGHSDSALMESSRRLHKMIGVVAEYVTQFPDRPETAELEGVGNRLLWVLDEVREELRKRAGAKE